MVGKTTTRQLFNPTARPSILTKLVGTVRHHQLFIPGQHLLVAVSGGADSIALLSLLHRLARSWRLTLTAIHCNYALRGAESDGDESFVREFCQERQVALVIHRPTLVRRRQRSSLQASARDARYDFMRQLAHEVGADHIAVGHTANDQAETVLMWMLRGAGMAGLAGMPYVREGRIIRPLLDATREEVVAYLDHEGLTYRRDSSNEKPLYRRNRIRQELLPVIIRLAPAGLRVLQRQADLLREDEQYLAQVTEDLVRRLVRCESGSVQHVDCQAFRALPVALQRRLIRAVLRGHDEAGRASSFRIVESVRRLFLQEKSEGRVSLKRVEVSLEKGAVRFCAAAAGEQAKMAPEQGKPKSPDLSISVPSTVYWARTKQQIHVQRMARRDAEERDEISSVQRALFDADRLSEPLVVRSWRAGDRFFPQGMKGKGKKLQDFFSDGKIARGRREDVPLLVAPEGIVWIVGMRQDERFLVRRDTETCLVVSVSSRISEKG